MTKEVKKIIMPKTPAAINLHSGYILPLLLTTPS
jgi:hypothetical protein